MKTLLKIAIVSAAFVASIMTAQATTAVSRTYVEGTYKYICIMDGSAESCGNWNVVSGT